MTTDSVNEQRSLYNPFDNLAAGSARTKGNCAVLDSACDLTARRKSTNEQGTTFSKIFRWQPSDPQASTPASVELAGSFTEWRVVALTRDAATNTWQVMLHGIPGNRTHRYMLLVNDEPVQDKNCDGLAVPEGFEEQQHQLMTARGPRVFLLFAQTK